ncbi:FtsQ-type POTRA domain-containing protein [Patescibacteria group bacterium]|nr:FtsQ-type POTRA domain-containing protein [Patescibacteria group bacterium]MBU1682472.1 FtsQ-type POTRA domain-containing protein [Patescibacteria group bacterium]MBU1935366.1 FtsQ-type POTRA domain-containing protein [Patescibacteria group bacterium]
MFFGKKKPQRLYVPTKSRWHTRPRRKPMVRRSRKIFTGNIRTRFTRFFKNALYFVVTGSILALLVIFLVFSSYFSILKIEVLRQDFNVDTAAITNQLNQYIGKNILFFQRSKVVNTVQENFPEFSSVYVKKILPNTIKVELEQYPIEANLRAYYILPKIETPLDEDEERIADIDAALESSFSLGGEEVTVEKEELTPIEQKCLLNQIGQAIFDQEEDLELMTITMDGLTQPIEDREIVIPQERMNFILDSIRYFNNLFEMQIRGIKYLPVAREVHFTTDTNLVIWITMAKEYKEQIDKLNTIYEVAELDQENIAYIDLRVREKVIYCPTNARCAYE